MKFDRIDKSTLRGQRNSDTDLRSSVSCTRVVVRSSIKRLKQENVLLGFREKKIFWFFYLLH
jgi:hypothetical protein